MSNRTFCVLLAGFLMLTGGLTFMIRNGGGQADVQQEAAVSSGESPAITSPVGRWQVVEEYGMRYDEALAQWEMRDYVLLAAEEGECVLSPVSGRVGRIEECPSGGAAVLIEGEGISACLWPVSGLRVFEGSGIERSDALGTAGRRLHLRIESEGKPADPEALIAGGAERS